MPLRYCHMVLRFKSIVRLRKIRKVDSTVPSEVSQTLEIVSRLEAQRSGGSEISQAHFDEGGEAL